MGGQRLMLLWHSWIPEWIYCRYVNKSINLAFFHYDTIFIYKFEKSFLFVHLIVHVWCYRENCVKKVCILLILLMGAASVKASSSQNWKYKESGSNKGETVEICFIIELLTSPGQLLCLNFSHLFRFFMFLNICVDDM